MLFPRRLLLSKCTKTLNPMDGKRLTIATKYTRGKKNTRTMLVTMINIGNIVVTVDNNMIQMSILVEDRNGGTGPTRYRKP